MDEQAAPAVDVVGLHKAFGEVKAVQDVSFAVGAGEVFSLLGPNGAGKTTTLDMLCGLTRPDDGEASVSGFSMRDDPLAAKARLGVVPQDLALYQDLSARANLQFFGRMYGLTGLPLQKRITEVLDLVGLTERSKDIVETHSGGMKRRLNIAVALLHQPKVVVMDEPTVGIDPQSRRHILDGVAALNAAGMSVVYTTHYMEEAEELSDRVGIMDRGVLIATGTPAELVAQIAEHARIEVELVGDIAAVRAAWQKLDGVTGVDGGEGRLVALAQDPDPLLPRLLEAAPAAGGRVTSVNVTVPDLEAVFLHLTGRALRD